MKKIYLAGLLLCSSLWVASQDTEKLSYQHQNIKSLSPETQGVKNQNSKISTEKSITSYGTVIGQTTYDFQSTFGTGTSRIQQYKDGGIAAVWIQSLNLFGGHADRGTGYNFLDPISQNWDTGETNWYGLNTVRTSAPQLLNLSDKEFTLQHDFVNSNIVVNSRDTIGFGSWGVSQGYSFDAVWPRAVNVGDTIHMIAIDNQGAAHNGISNPLKYFRSDDAGLTWSIVSFVNFPNYDDNTFWFSEITEDAYAIDAYQNYVSIVMGGGWDPLVLYKSDNFGENGSWTKTVIYKPDSTYSYYDATSLRHVVPSLSSDMSVVIDHSGLTHVSSTGLSINWYFGEDKPQNSGGIRQYNPLSSLGIYYWNENMGSIDHIYNNFISTDSANGNVLYPLCYFYDYTGDGNYDIPSDPNSIGTYSSGLAGHSNIAIDQDSGIFVVWSQVGETSQQVLAENYRDLYLAYTFDKGENWSGPLSVAGLEVADDGFSGGTLAEEDVFPSTIKRVGNDNLLHMTFQSDGQVGMHVVGDLHPIALNDIVYYPIDLQQVRNISGLSKSNYSNKSFSVFPNPTKSLINIEFEENTNIHSIEIFNLIGKSISTFNINESAKAINLNLGNIESGIYLLKVVSDKGEKVKKIVVE